MKIVEWRLPQEFDKSFIVFKDSGRFFPCPWHYHPEYELVLVTKSTGKRMVGDHIGYFDEDDLVFMGPMVPHVWVNDPEYLKGDDKPPAEAIVIHFQEGFLGQNLFNIPEMANFKSFLHSSKHGMAIKGTARKRINHVMKNMIGMNGLQRLSCLFEIFDILSRTSEYELLISPGFIQNYDFKGTDRYSRITEYILHNFHEEITLPLVASHANMAITTFCNFFKAQFRMTFVEYLNSVRVGHACKLLSDRDQTIVQIAYRCGYSNLANFNKQFRKIKRMTPTDFRRKLEIA
jgi:AraC-like DNA-binding protein